MIMPEIPIEKIEAEIYDELIREIPGIMPVLARFLAKTAAERVQRNRAANLGKNELLSKTRQVSDDKPTQDHENTHQ